MQIKQGNPNLLQIPRLFKWRQIMTTTSAQFEGLISRDGNRPRPASYIHNKKIKKGIVRQERHSGTGMSPSPKKSGKGGRYTWEGPFDYATNSVSDILDEKDPNYVDEEM